MCVYCIKIVKLLAYLGEPGELDNEQCTAMFARCVKGMNRLVAILLLFLKEEDAFWGLVAIIESLLPAQYYDRTLIAAHADQVHD